MSLNELINLVKNHFYNNSYKPDISVMIFILEYSLIKKRESILSFNLFLTLMSKPHKIIELI